MESVWPVSKLSIESVGSRRELVANSCAHRRREATRQFRLVGGVYWALLLIKLCSGSHSVNNIFCHVIQMNVTVFYIALSAISYHIHCWMLICLAALVPQSAIWSPYLSQVNGTTVLAIVASLSFNFMLVIVHILVIKLCALYYKMSTVFSLL